MIQEFTAATQVPMEGVHTVPMEEEAPATQSDDAELANRVRELQASTSRII